MSEACRGGVQRRRLICWLEASTKRLPLPPPFLSHARHQLGAGPVQPSHLFLPFCLNQLLFASCTHGPPPDTSWLRDPSDYLAHFASADFFISTDCLSVAVEQAWQPRHNQPRCGHIPGNGWGRAFNTGGGPDGRPASEKPVNQLGLPIWKAAVLGQCCKRFGTAASCVQLAQQ